MQPDRETCLRALRSRDPRFDGRFFAGVSSTRIYCRPVCTVRAPKPENCTFYVSAAAAEAMGYRPCMRCRPELAPGNASVDATHRIAQAAATLIEDGLHTELSLEAIAERLNVTDRHLRRVFQAEFGVPPVAYAQTQRLLLAKRLLTDTTMPVTDVAFAAGFGSIRRFDTLFKERYRLTPMQLRKHPKESALPDSLTFELSYRPPYDWPAIQQFLTARAITGVEESNPLTYRRIVSVKDHKGWIQVSASTKKPTLQVIVSASLAGCIPAVLARVKHLFDLSCNPGVISEVLGSLAAANPGQRVPGAFDGFEIAVRAVLGQQISVAGARTLAGRFTATFGTPVATPFKALTTAFPPPARIATLQTGDIASLGIIATRANSIIALAKAIREGGLKLTPGVDVNQTIATLTTLPGIGEWTAQYIAMRALAWPDAFPHTDLIIMKVLGTKKPKESLAAGNSWQPWRAYATMHLWRKSHELTTSELTN